MKNLLLLSCILSLLSSNEVKLILENKLNFQEKYDFYTNERYKLPPRIDDIRAIKEDDFDINFDVDLDTEKKEISAIKFDIGKKF